MSKREIMNMDNLNDDHKEAATYVVDFLNESGQKVLAELISKRFQLKPVERYDIEKSFIPKWCKENNYRLIRIYEEDYQDVKQIENFIYNSKEQIIKVGNRYL